MISTLGEILPQVVIIVASPVPWMAVVLVLLSLRPRDNGVAFALGWFLGLLAFGLVALSVAGLLPTKRESGLVHALIDFALAGLLFWLAFRSWQKRPKPGEEPKLPKWMASIDSFTPASALRNGALLAGLNPKHIAITLSAVETIAQAELQAGQGAVVMLAYALLGSFSVVAPVIYYLVDGERARQFLGHAKEWLGANSELLMALLLLVLGALIFGRGLGGVFA